MVFNWIRWNESSAEDSSINPAWINHQLVELKHTVNYVVSQDNYWIEKNFIDIPTISIAGCYLKFVSCENS